MTQIIRDQSVISKNKKEKKKHTHKTKNDTTDILLKVALSTITLSS